MHINIYSSYAHIDQCHPGKFNLKKMYTSFVHLQQKICVCSHIIPQPLTVPFYIGFFYLFFIMLIFKDIGNFSLAWQPQKIFKRTNSSKNVGEICILEAHVSHMLFFALDSFTAYGLPTSLEKQGQKGKQECFSPTLSVIILYNVPNNCNSEH